MGNTKGRRLSMRLRLRNQDPSCHRPALCSSRRWCSRGAGSRTDPGAIPSLPLPGQAPHCGVAQPHTRKAIQRVTRNIHTTYYIKCSRGHGREQTTKASL